MPAELTQARLKRRASRKDLDEYGGLRFDTGHARELEQKRIRGSLSTGQGTRFVLAATEHLHRRIATLSARIRLLEDALMSLQASHPLLHPDLVTRDNADLETMDEEGNGDQGDKEKGGGGDVIDAFGTLSISDHGISRFFGPTGGVESLLISNLSLPPNQSTPTISALPSPHLHSSSPSSSSSVPVDPLALFSSSFPFTPLGSPAGVQDLIASHLPSRSTAEGLVQTYLTQCSWLFHGVTKAQLDEMVPVIYDRTEQRAELKEGEMEGGNGDGEGDYSGPHDIALLFVIFAVGALVRPSGSSMGTEPVATSSSASPSSTSHARTYPHLTSLSQSPPNPTSPTSRLSTSAHITSTTSNNALGEHFHQLSRVALALQPILEKPSLVTIQTLHLLSIYNAMSGSDLRSETSMEMTWSLITLAGHLSMTIGLHRDSARWGLTPKMVQRRRILFWDLFVADVWQSLNTGRPPSLSLAYIDCSFPDGASGEGAETGFGSAFSTWQCRFAAECVAEVTSRTLTAEAPTYATIMELDKKVREFPLPEGMGSAEGRMKAKGGDLAGSFQKCVLDHIRETVLMYIHRSFFAQAIIEHPANPLKSAYAPSFLAAYRAASTILKSVREQFGIWPNSCARFWTMWTFAFSAAVVFGTVVTRGPKSPLAQSAMGELEQACILFSKASVYSIRATKALPILTRLAEKARLALSVTQKDSDSLSDTAAGLLWNIQVKQERDEDDELAIFAGHTRFVSARKPAADPSSRLQQQEQQQQNSYSSYPLQPVNGWPGQLEDMNVSHAEHPAMSRQLPPLPLHYPYAPSERSTRDLEFEIYGSVPSEWEGPSASIQQQQSVQPQRVSPSQFYSPPALQLSPPSRASPPPTHHQQQTYPVQTYLQHPHQQQQHQRRYPQQVFAGNTELADLGLAARDSRLDERWSSFMHESGILEDINLQRR
ncbi:hypothetical protein C0995_006495 [Termitomyces sp. Mi166|nr:hypothetical protein C0995_006495 [Termitomyces sp. Mi166\